EPDAAQAAAQPGVTQRAVEGDGLIKLSDGRGELLAGSKEKAFDGEGLGVTRGKAQRAADGVQCQSRVAKTKLQLGDSRPAESKISRAGHGGAREPQGGWQIGCSLRL